MKKYITPQTIAMSLLLFTIACEEGNLDKVSNTQRVAQTKRSLSNGRLTNYSFDGTEGGPIALDTAKNWIANYAAKFPTGTKSFFFGKGHLEKALSTNGSFGIRIYYAADNLQQSHLLLVGVDGNGNDLLPRTGISGKTSADKLIADTLETFSGMEGDSIQNNVMTLWISNYTSQNPQKIQAHFFGFEIVRQILGETGCKGIRVYYALNSSGVQQLLLVGASGNGASLLPSTSTNGRTTDSGNYIGDMSFPCPTYCSGT